MLNKTNFLKQKGQYGYTLIELLVSITIFSAIIGMGSTILATGYLAGRSMTTQQAKINRDISFINDTIYQKSINANVKNAVTGINGFMIIDTSTGATNAANGNLLALASSGPTGDVCSYIGWNKTEDKKLYIYSENCNNGLKKTIDTSKAKLLSSSDGIFSDFNLEYSSLKPQLFKLTMSEIDPKGTNKTSVRNTYNVNY